MFRKTTSPAFLKWARALKQCKNSNFNAISIFEKYKGIPKLPKLFVAEQNNAMYYSGPISHFIKCIGQLFYFAKLSIKRKNRKRKEKA
jgi:hypothetical protein